MSGGSPNIRTRAEVKAERATLMARLNVLALEDEEIRQAEATAICRAFDAGRDPREIAKDMKTSLGVVQGILWRAGRTQKGRAVLRERIAVAVAEGARA